MSSEQERIPEGIHLPAPSYYPIVLSFGVVLVAVGVLWTSILIAIGLTVVLAAIAGWTQENRGEAQHHG